MAKTSWDEWRARLAGPPAYATWWGMHQRCGSPRQMDYSNYGGRGITVCDRWFSYQNFLDDMGPKPPGKSLDRINVNGNYEPSNCRWASHKEQNFNRRSKAQVARDWWAQQPAKPAKPIPYADTLENDLAKLPAERAFI